MSIFIWSYESVEILQQKWQRWDPSEPEQIVRVCSGKVRVWHGFSTRFKNIVFWKDTMYLCQKFGLARVKYGFSTGSAWVQNKPELFSVGCLKMQSKSHTSPSMRSIFWGVQPWPRFKQLFSRLRHKRNAKRWSYHATIMIMIGWFVYVVCLSDAKSCENTMFFLETRCFRSAPWKTRGLHFYPAKS